MVLSLARGQEEIEDALHSSIASRYETRPLPKFTVPDVGLSKEGAYQVIHDELQMDGNPKFDLGSFTTTFMEPECDKIIMETLNKNYIDMDEYPITTNIQDRCVNMIANLFHAPLENGANAVGTGTVGSSEAIMLAGLAFKRKWQHRRKAEGKPHDKPNIVTGANVQVCWEKFASYFEVELKDTKLREDFYVMDPHEAIKLVDENTICVAAILGSTYTGEFEDVKLLNDLLLQKNKETGWNIPIHVDAASGGFVAPFIYPELEWDFRLPLVRSINVSGHKYGLVYPGIGWNIWRTKDDLPEELIFHINYLGTDQPTFTLNFSKGASQVIAQYYQLIRLGFQGYKEIMSNTRDNATALREQIVALGKFKLLSKDVGVPLVSFTLKDRSKCYDEHDISGYLKRFGWMIPAYSLAPNAQDITLMRVVVREDFGRHYVDKLVQDIKQSIDYLEGHPPHLIDAIDASSLSKTNPELAQHIASHQQKQGESKASHKGGKEDTNDPNHPSKKGSAFDPHLNKQGGFRRVKKYGGISKANGPC